MLTTVLVVSAICGIFGIILTAANKKLQVEVDERIFSDEIKQLQILAQTIEKEIKDLLGVSCKVRLVEPKTIARSEGKAQRVIDKRKR